jgi:hypothetical protein
MSARFARLLELGLTLAGFARKLLSPHKREAASWLWLIRRFPFAALTGGLSPCRFAPAFTPLRSVAPVLALPKTAMAPMEFSTP